MTPSFFTIAFSTLSKGNRHLFLSAVTCCVLFAILPSGSRCVASAGSAAGSYSVRTARSGVPITFTLPRSEYVTLVIDDKNGRRIRNLISETLLPEGSNTITWDGYDEGDAAAGGDAVVRHRVPPGDYIVRGLTHTGIHLRYEFPIYSPGKPPWFTLDGTGGWLGDHTPASGIAFVPQGASPFGNGAPQIMIGSVSGEAGNPNVWLGLDGQKLRGGLKVDGWFGSRAMATDMGPKPDPEFYAYGIYLNGGAAKSVGLIGFAKDKPDEAVKIASIDCPQPEPFNGEHVAIAIAAYNGIVVVSDDLGQRLLFVDVGARKILGQTAVNKPRGVSFDVLGRLYLVSNGQVVRYDHPDLSAAALGDGIALISEGLDQPRNVFVAGDGRIFVSDWGGSHQVKVFAADGTSLFKIGHPGGPQVGPYDDQQMHFPNFTTIDSNGALWVTEDDSLPRRVSLWSAKDGSFIKAIYGSVCYGGNGLIDPGDRTRAYYAADFQSGGANGGMEFKLDWASGTYKLVSIYMRGVEPPTDADHARHENMAADALPETNVPEYPVTIGANHYLINTYNGSERYNNSSGIWKLDAHGVAWPVAFIGGGSYWLQRFFTSTDSDCLNRDAVRAEIERQLQALHGTWADAFITWSDLNGNHRIDPEEVHVKVFPYAATAYDPAQPITWNNHASFFCGNSLDPRDLSLTGGWSVKSAPPVINGEGIPVYDLANVHLTMRPTAAWRDRVDFDVADRFDSAPNGWLLMGAWRGFKNGQLVWTYPARGKQFPPQKPGELVSPTRPMSPVFTPQLGQAGPTIAMNGDNGAMYLMTVDGLFLQTLGGDIRTHPLIRFPVAHRGMLMDGYSFDDELFHPQLTRTDAGPIYLVAGKEDSCIYDVEGFESVKRRQFETLNLTENFLSVLPETEEEAPLGQARQTATVPILNAEPPVDADITKLEHAGVGPLTIDSRATGMVAATHKNLLALWSTGDPNLLDGSSGDYRFAFKYGGALDLMIGTDPEARQDRQTPSAGDIRLLVSRPGGKLRCVLYRQVAPGAGGHPVEFTSPVGHVAFDDVVDITNLVTFAQSGGDYEVSVPLSALALSAHTRERIAGDIGILRGNGAQTTQRVYWNNTDTGVVSDIPTEARLQPANWGEWLFEPDSADGTDQAVPVPTGSLPGLHYDYYEGPFRSMPDFSKLTPLAGGTTSGFSINPRKRDTYYALRWTGYVNVPKDGVYTFHVRADDGAQLFIGSHLVVDASWEANVDVAGSIYLYAGYHSIGATYYQIEGGQSLTVTCAGPNMPAGPLTADALCHAPN